MIKVSEKLFINADSKNYILQNKVISKGEERMEAIGFYTSLEDLLYGIIKHDLRKFISKKEIEDVQALIKELKEIDRKVKELNVGKI